MYCIHTPCVLHAVIEGFFAHTIQIQREMLDQDTLSSTRILHAAMDLQIT